MTWGSRFRGVFSVLVTPFHDDGAVDEASLDRLVDFLLARGVHGLTVLAVMGEAAQLSAAEREQVAARVLRRVNGRIPVVVGVWGDRTEATSADARRAVQLGAAAVLVAPPRGPAEAVSAFVHEVGEAARIPLFLLDAPLHHGVVLPVPFLERLARESEWFAGIKLEERPTPPKIERLKAALGARLAVFGGSGGIYALPELERGADGIMSGLAVPEKLVELFARFQKHDLAGAAAAYDCCLPLAVFEFQDGIGIALRKQVLRHRGVLSSAAVRPPTHALDDGTRAQLLRLLERLSI